MSVIQIILLLLSFFLIFGILIIGFEKKIIYYPYKYPLGNWDLKSIGLPVEEVYFESDAHKLHGWYIPHEKAATTLLWFHGNAGNISHRLDNILRLQPLKLNIFIFDYRGYGRSAGEPDEKGLYQDSLAAYDVLIKKKEILSENLFLFGRSLGGICAVHVAAKRPAAGLILESTFTSARDMVKKMFPFLPLGYFIRSKFDAQKMISSVKIPKLFLHGTEDDVVPYRLGKKLFAAASQPKQFYDISQAGHNDTYLVGGAAYFNEINRFIEETQSKPTHGMPPRN